jgi:Protein of unknown function (DUF3179)
MEIRHRSRALWGVGLSTLLIFAACARSGPDVSSRPAASDPAPLVDPGDIIAGGPPPDGIPPIDRPRFLAPSAVDFLDAQEPVLSLEVGGDARAYPLQILIWHEIVNDVVGNTPVTITYCPLCNTGIAFKRPRIEGRLLDFGTSGKLYRSNLLMYDRQTKTLWAQATGRAVMGRLTGTQLEFLPVHLVSWADWRAGHPSGKVLSRDTGADRPYGQNPYEGYDREDSTPFLFKGDLDPPLPPLARVVGVRIGGDAVAFPYERLRARAVGGWAVAESTVGSIPVVVVWKQGALSALDAGEIAASRAVGAVGVFDARVDGRTFIFQADSMGVADTETGSRWDILGRAVAGPLAGRELTAIIATDSFWFDWAAFYPETRIFT